jgi:hypothetical protein
LLSSNLLFFPIFPSWFFIISPVICFIFLFFLPFPSFYFLSLTRYGV